ncbi:MAG: hypothetical protein IPM76_20660 [Chloroflexi bacterium]|nr:hypothetical protein [Chloroflexota bacterium]
MPSFLANGGAQQLTLPLRVETADITHPEQKITAQILNLNDQIRQAETSIWIGIPPQVNSLVIPAQVSVGFALPNCGLT